MAYFDAKKDTVLTVDTSPVGLSGILSQRSACDAEGKVVAYASRALSDVERRYSQTEKEALSIVWAIEHFHLYLYGHLFTLETDHKPLEMIYGRANSKPCARIERWVLRLQPYNSSINQDQLIRLIFYHDTLLRLTLENKARWLMNMYIL